MIAAELAVMLDGDLGLGSAAELWTEIEALSSAHAGMTAASLRAPEGHDGVLAGLVAGRVVKADDAAGRPAMLRFAPDGPPSETPALDAYSLRLVSSRKLYDLGVALQRSSSLAGLADPAVLRMNPTDHERLGLAERAQAKVISSRTTFLVDAVADPAVARGVVALAFNLNGARAADLIDATATVTDVRVETP
jgi:anaerobic selenocysteine-containing dehydrogenase